MKLDNLNFLNVLDKVTKWNQNPKHLVLKEFLFT